MRDAFADLVLGSTCLGCRRPGRRVCPGCGAALPDSVADTFAVVPDPCPDGLAPVVAAAGYDGLVRQLVVQHKEEQAFGLVRPLARLLTLAVRSALADLPDEAAPVPVPVPVLVPVPSRPATVRARGHDPLRRTVLRTARTLRREGVAVAAVPLLRQVRRPADQSGLDAGARASNLTGAFAVAPAAMRRWHGAGIPIAIVCDDVVTTGSTVREAQRALEVAGVPVHGIAVVAATRLRRRRGSTP